MTHTEGPWDYRSDHLGAYRIVDEADRVVAETRPEGNCNSSGSEQANARLISAAPELLKTCKELVYLFPDLPEILGGQSSAKAAELIAAARAAIDKAEGR